MSSFIIAHLYDVRRIFYAPVIFFTDKKPDTVTVFFIYFFFDQTKIYIDILIVIYFTAVVIVYVFYYIAGRPSGNTLINYITFINVDNWPMPVGAQQ